MNIIKKQIEGITIKGVIIRLLWIGIGALVLYIMSPLQNYLNTNMVLKNIAIRLLQKSN